MPRRNHSPAVGEYYHVFNRGVEKRSIFLTDHDYYQFLEILEYYLNPIPPIAFSQRHRIHIQDPEFPDDPLVEVIAYCLMPNHFHILVRVVREHGLVTWIRRSTNSYTHIFNIRNDRVGPLFQGPYKAVHVESDEQLIHLSRYIHLNPVVARICEDAHTYRFSSMQHFNGSRKEAWIRPAIILNQFTSPDLYQSFVDDHIDYARELDRIKHSLLE